jgi:hypothetical protein
MFLWPGSRIRLNSTNHDKAWMDQYLLAGVITFLSGSPPLKGLKLLRNISILPACSYEVEGVVS